MKKNEFIEALRAKLIALNAQDIERSLDYYSEIIDDCMEDGMTEDEAVAQVGTVEEAVANIVDELSVPNMKPAQLEEKKTAPAGGASYMGIAFDSLHIEDAESDVILIPSQDGGCCVEWNEKLPHTAEVVCGVLTVKRLTERKWFQFFSLHGEQAKLIVRMPAGKYNDLFVSTASGDIRISADFAFNTSEVHSASGDVEFYAGTAEKLRAKSTSGDVKVESVSPLEMELSSVSGDVNCACVKAKTGLSIKTVSGDIEAADLDCGSLLVKSVSGDIKLDKTVADAVTAETISGDVSFRVTIGTKTMNVRTTSGDVRFTGCDGGEINVKTSSGSVHGSLLTGKMFHCTSHSGSVNVPAPTPGGICSVTSSSGSIRLKVE